MFLKCKPSEKFNHGEFIIMKYSASVRNCNPERLESTAKHRQ